MGKKTRRFPVIDTGQCSRCQGCEALVPEVFYMNEDTGRMAVASFEYYPEDEVNEAIKNCPKDCISWNTPDTAGLQHEEFTEEEILGIG